LRRAHAQGLAPDMACAETAIGIELIERRGIVMAPTVVVERRRPRQKSGKSTGTAPSFALSLRVPAGEPVNCVGSLPSAASSVLILAAPLIGAARPSGWRQASMATSSKLATRFTCLLGRARSA